jgi:hypothetical protein
MRSAVEIVSDAMICIQSFWKIGIGIQAILNFASEIERL